jgi:NADH-quinone oxidoreductase subunit G
VKKVTLLIDGKEITTTAGKTILEAALDNGIEIPHFCYHETLGQDGNCRICLVEIEGNPKLETSCTTPAAEGMKVLTDSEDTKRARAGILEFILLNHPLDCPVCDKAGECKLQDYAYDQGRSHSRLKYDKKHYPVKDLGPNIYLWTERCIKCARCIRFLDDVAETSELGFFNRGSQTELDIFEGIPVDNPVSLNIVDTCPVGALIDKDFLFQARVWDMKKTESICPDCSSGCNIHYWSMDNILKRITIRKNPDVTTPWLCDRGRRSYKNVDDRKRLVDHKTKAGKKISLEDSLEQIINSCEETKDKYGAESILALGSPYLTNEENYLIRKIFGDHLGAQLGMLPPVIDGSDQIFGDGFTIRAEKAPNRAGAAAALGISSSPEKHLSKLLDEVKTGKIKLVVIFNGDPNLEFTKSQISSLKKANAIFLCESFKSTGIENSADIILAGNMPAEKDGTFTTIDGVTQRIRRAVFKPLNSVPELKILLQMASQWRIPLKAGSPSGVFDDLAKNIDFFKGADYESIGTNGFNNNKTRGN